MRRKSWSSSVFSPWASSDKLVGFFPPRWTPAAVFCPGRVESRNGTAIEPVPLRSEPPAAVYTMGWSNESTVRTLGFPDLASFPFLAWHPSPCAMLHPTALRFASLAARATPLHPVGAAPFLTVARTPTPGKVPPGSNGIMPTARSPHRTNLPPSRVLHPRSRRVSSTAQRHGPFSLGTGTTGPHL